MAGFYSEPIATITKVFHFVGVVVMGEPLAFAAKRVTICSLGHFVVEVAVGVCLRGFVIGLAWVAGSIAGEVTVVPVFVVVKQGLAAEGERAWGAF